ncbi:hypothetical protein ACU8KI_34010 (plasmid) [Rhizobium leguminosarum]|jgi:hypothetical protein
MKILKIESGRGYFRIESSAEWREIDQIDKDGLLALLDLFLDADTEMDAPDETILHNEVHKIIYTHVFQKLSSLSDSKSTFKDDSERLYFDEITKYATG